MLVTLGELAHPIVFAAGQSDGLTRMTEPTRWVWGGGKASRQDQSECVHQ